MNTVRTHVKRSLWNTFQSDNPQNVGGVSIRWIQVLCKDNRIPGAFRVGNTWAIPSDAEKPKDARIKSGKYIKTYR